MSDYKHKRTYVDGSKHIVYYLHTPKNIPCSLGWDYNEIKDMAEKGVHLSVCVKREES